MNTPAPIVLFAYNRPEHLRATVATLKTNALAASSELFVYCDGSKVEGDASVAEVHRFVDELDGFASVTVIKRETNWGLAQNIIDGVTSVLSKYEKVIVLEDDLVLSPHFLAFMNEALDLYGNEERVAGVSGWSVPHRRKMRQETYFLTKVSSWGWGTWRRAWRYFEPDAKQLLKTIEEKGLGRDFDIDGAYPHVQMLKDHIEGRVNSWAIRWGAVVFLRNMLMLYPTRSLVFQGGFDGSGTHCGKDTLWQQESLALNVPNRPIPVKEDQLGRYSMQQWSLVSFGRNVPFPVKLLSSILPCRRWRHSFRARFSRRGH